LLFASPFDVCLTFCALDFDGQVNFASRSELVSSYNFVWLFMVFLWLTPYDLVLKSGAPITFDSRSGVSFFGSSLVLGFIWCSFGGSEVVRWWKRNDISNRSF
jgi:hypothetical protein